MLATLNHRSTVRDSSSLALALSGECDNIYIFEFVTFVTGCQNSN